MSRMGSVPIVVVGALVVAIRLRLAGHPAARGGLAGVSRPVERVAHLVPDRRELGVRRAPQVAHGVLEAIEGPLPTALLVRIRHATDRCEPEHTLER